MKRFLALFLVVTMLFSLVACGENTDTNSWNTNINNITDKTQNTTDMTTNIGQNSSWETTVPLGDNSDTANLSHTHEYVDKITIATCTKEGYTLHTCSCGDSYSDNKTTATGHSFGEWNTTKEPTPTAIGTAERKCSKCNETETKTLGRLIENHKHNYVSKITVSPTCKAEGKRTYSCFCGDTYSESVASVEHQYSHKITNPTCTNEGYTTYTCTVCGNTYRDNFTHPTEHNWKAATCTVEKTCLSCGKTEGIAYGHTWKAATCTQPSTCKQCGETTGTALGHDWKAATCTDAKKCKVCKVTEGSANGHIWIEGNCTMPKTCSVCKKTDGDVVHKYENGRCIICGYKKSSTGLGFYKYKEGYYLLTTGTCTDTNIVIPATYKGLPVVGIYKDFSTRTNNSDGTVVKSDSITSIHLPNSITVIEARAFLNCSNLTNIVFDGTKQQWSAISKGEHWYSAFSTIVVTCTDGIFTYS